MVDCGVNGNYYPEVFRFGNRPNYLPELELKRNIP